MADSAAVSRWIKTWLSAWRVEPMVMLSPLSVQLVRERLTAGRISYFRAAFMLGGEGGYRVVGRIGTHRITLEAAKVGVRNSWRPVLRGRLEPAGAGSRLVGTLGWHPAVKAFSALWLGAVSCFFLGFVVRAGVLAWNGNATGEEALLCLVPLAFIVFFVGLNAWAIRVGRDEARYLRSWLAERLQTADSGIPGYRPWQGRTPL